MEKATLTLLGTGTSQGVPVLGCTCEVCRSTDPRDNRLRASALITTSQGNINVDVGPDFRLQLLRERANRLDAVIITHEHNDHTAGLDDIRPFCFRQGTDIPVYGLSRVVQDMRKRFSYAFSDYPGVPRFSLHEVDFYDTINEAGVHIELLKVLHGKLPILGLRIGDLAYLTDVKSLPQTTLEKLQGIRTLIISALHHSGTHSHLSLDEALSYIEMIKPQRSVLFHLSHTMGTTASLSARLPDGVEVGWDGMKFDIELTAY